jgi:hypothetical protein
LAIQARPAKKIGEGEMFIMGFSRWQLFKALTAIVGIIGIVSLALIYFIPAPPSKVVMATAFKGASFDYYGRQYREIFARYNFELELRETAGAVENVKLLQDPNSGVQIGFVTGGVSNAKQAPDVLSLGTVYNQPFWIFYTSKEQLDRLSQLKGKRIAVGPVGSATRYTAEQILGRGGVNSETATLLPFAGSEADRALNDGKVDAVWIIGVPEATAVQSFLRNPNVRLMSFPTAEAFTRIFPDLTRLILPQGVVDIDAIGFPLFRFLPQLYNWMTRRRLFYWYAHLKALEASFDVTLNDKHLAEKQAEIERIEDAVSQIRFPLSFSDQVYNLRSHIDIVRRKIASRAPALGRMAAE